MKKLSMKHFSFLGLALFATSAITSAFTTHQAKSSDEAKVAMNGLIRQGTAGVGSTCTLQEQVNCYASTAEIGFTGTTGDNTSQQTTALSEGENGPNI